MNIEITSFGKALRDRDPARVNLFGKTDDLPHQAVFDCDGGIRGMANQLYDDPNCLRSDAAWDHYVNSIAVLLAKNDFISFMRSLGLTAILPFHLAKNDENPYQLARSSATTGSKTSLGHSMQNSGNFTIKLLSI